MPENVIRLASLDVPAIPVESAKDYPSVFRQTCASCHADSEFTQAPRIPFDDESALRNMLAHSDLADRIWKRINDPEGYQMAPTKILSPAEREEVRRFIGK